MNKDIDYILSAKAVRERTAKIFDLTLEGKTNFNYHEDKLEGVSKFVLEVIRENYPDLKIPFHSRWGHFQVGSVDRNAKLDSELSSLDKVERARVKLDLVITSVLLDAGAGPTWKFDEEGVSYNRSEGLGVASWHMFMNGAFSNDGSRRADAKKLMAISKADIEKAFQVSEKNPLVGAQGRAGLLASLGKCIESKPEIFKDGRPGNIIDYMIGEHGQKFAATDLLKAVLLHFGDIWPSRITVDGVSLGDVWNHPSLGEKDDLNSLVAFHKLSQWLTYSLIEPIVEAGCEVHSVNEMTGLAEYRNGGLLIDMDLISLKDPALLEVAHKPDSEVIIEWRALTVCLLDKIADIVRKELNFSEEEFPLAKVLEGGTWWAGRKVAKQKREDSSPPLKLDSDGTVF
ncbi:uracil phosphoribosyltransferase [Halobacteriovorax marinus]|uniref:URC4/urg3 family protein n=1 Tax=Halobacteriovorax marinus TaxID=97084 RepID=UPI000BC3138E|nr:URC4/urg3 family protein [Halobacteriovorax marinus]ATH06935.1 uracil phosphoribosyltransferase [Halobacteriovorax marinus]